MARTLLGACVSLYSSAGLDAAAKIWVSQAPEGSDLPLVVLVHQGEVPEWTTERAYEQMGNLQFLVFSKGAAAVEDLALEIMQTFDWTTSLSITGATGIEVMRTNYLVAVEEPRAQDGEIVYRAEISYKVRTTRTY